MQSKYLFLIVCLLNCCIFLACPSAPRGARQFESIATVGQREIKTALFRAELLRAGAVHLVDRSEQVKLGEIVLNRLIEDTLLFEAACSNNFSVSDAELNHAWRKNSSPFTRTFLRRALHLRNTTPAQYREQLKKHLLVEKYLVDQLPKISVPDAIQSSQSIRDAKTPISIFARVRARQILLESEEEARLVLKQIRNNQISFENAAQRYSKAPDATQLGDLGWFTKGEMPAVFDHCFSLGKMEISNIFASPYGFHIFQVIDVKPLSTESSDEAKNRIEKMAVHEQEVTAMKYLIATLRKNTRIKINQNVFMKVIDRLSLKERNGRQT